MNANFTNGGVKYHLVVTRDSRRKIEAVAENIQPDRSLWKSCDKRKRGRTSGVDSDPEYIVRSRRNGSRRRKPDLTDFDE